MRSIDLHTHTTASDGSDTPDELIAKVKQAKLSAVAITDHDTINGIGWALNAARSADIELIPGCEISTASEYGSHHILGLWVPDNNRELKMFLTEARKRRARRNAAMIEKLIRLNIKISPQDFKNIPLENLGRPHFAQCLLEKGYVPTLAAAFGEYLGSSGKAYVPKSSPPPEAAIEVLARAGATVVWAHPLLQNMPLETLNKLTARFSQAGLSTLEVWHSAHTPEQNMMLLQMANKYGLAVSGGSDYHGKAKPEIMPGTGYGNLHIPYSVLENLKTHRKNRGLPC